MKHQLSIWICVFHLKHYVIFYFILLDVYFITFTCIKIIFTGHVEIYYIKLNIIKNVFLQLITIFHCLLDKVSSVYLLCLMRKITVLNFTLRVTAAQQMPLIG